MRGYDSNETAMRTVTSNIKTIAKQSMFCSKPICNKGSQMDNIVVT